MSITSSQLLDGRYVEVHGKQGRQKAEYVVYFSRQATITGGYQFAPEEGYRVPDAIPEPIKTAAAATYAKRFDRAN
jgi:hypothetical protein